MQTIAKAGNITLLLRQMQSGEPSAKAVLMEVIYPELRRIARERFQGERKERVLQPTALVNEVYLRLTRHREHNWRDRTHFFAAASKLMRRILTDSARTRLANKRRGLDLPMNEAFGITDDRSGFLLALNDALSDLAKAFPRQAEVVEMRYFGGLSVAETAEALSLTTRTIDRDWDFARAWLRRYLEQ